jgi:thiol:disulfide interchange protein DsbC
MTLTRLACLAALAGIASGALAQATGTPRDASAQLRATLTQRYPEVHIEAIEASPVAGLYAVFAGGRVLYADASGDYLLLGKLVDTRTRRDLSADALDAHNSIDFAKLPFADSIRIVRGSGVRRLAIFEDPDCPYCLELEKQLRSVNDVTIFVFLLPLEDLHPNATAHARAIWCARDRGRAWSEWMSERTAPAVAECTSDPIGATRALAESLRITSTPTLFLESGRRLGGALPASELETLLGAPAPPVKNGG